MPATRRHMNWSNISFVPDGGTINLFTGVTDCSYDPQGTLEEFSGDGDRYTTTVVNSMNRPKFTVTAADIAAILAIAVGVVGTFSATLNDAHNIAGTGAITFTMANAVVNSGTARGAHKQFASGAFDVMGFSPDGQTNPVSVSIAA
jgi:hypothetical protein